MTPECPCPSSSCSYSSDSITLLHVHCINAHPKEFFTCPWCTVPFATLRSLQKHATNCSALDKDEPREGEINTVLVNNDKCLVCEGRFNSAEAAIKHYKEQHLNFSYICDVCEMYFQHNASLDVHYATCHAKSNASMAAPIPSPKNVPAKPKRNNKRNASIAFNEIATNSSSARKKKISLATRSRSASSSEDISVQPAKKIKFSSTSPIHKREAMLLLNKLHCLDCKLDFAHLNEIVEHYKTEHEFEVYECSRCDTVYLSISGLSKHQRKHSKSENPKSNRANEKAIPARAADNNESEANQQVPTNDQVPAHRQVTANHQPVFACYLCPFEAITGELIEAHLADDHNQLMPIKGDVKLENLEDVNVSSTMIKMEPESSSRSYIARMARYRVLTHGYDAIIDLTSGD